MTNHAHICHSVALISKCLHLWFYLFKEITWEKKKIVVCLKFRISFLHITFDFIRVESDITFEIDENQPALNQNITNKCRCIIYTVNPDLCLFYYLSTFLSTYKKLNVHKKFSLSKPEVFLLRKLAYISLK